MYRRRPIILLLIAILISSCHQGIIFEETAEIPAGVWSQDHFLTFFFPVADTIEPCNISLIIRNDARYEYSNLFLFINTVAPGGQTIRDTIEVRMADVSGKWYGKGIGGKYTLEVPFKTHVVFPQPGNYLIEIEQGMREVKLRHITDLGIKVKKMKL